MLNAKKNRIGGVMVSVLALSVADRGFIGGVMVSVPDRGFIGGVMVSVLALSAVVCGSNQTIIFVFVASELSMQH